MSRTDKDVPYSVATERDPGHEDWHYGCQHDTTGRRRRRWVSETIEREPHWYLLTEYRDVLGGAWSESEPPDALRVKTRQRWVYGPRSETTGHWVFEVVECDMDEPTGRCRRFGTQIGMRYSHPVIGPKKSHIKAIRGGARVRERSELRDLAVEFNNYGDIDSDDVWVPEEDGWW